MALHCYGENSLTFLLFQALRPSEDCQLRHFHDHLLSQLKQFGTGKKLTDLVPGIDRNAIPDIWLFPNFGKTYGFGEPDALVLFGQYSFWFEVETVVNLRTRLPALKRALLQLSRFHLFHQALMHRAKVRKNIGVPHVVIMGPTISNSGRPRFGILRQKGHPVLKEIQRELENSSPHYVLLSEQAAGIPGRKFHEELGAVHRASSADLRCVLQQWSSEVGYQEKDFPQLPGPERHWYAHWKADLESKFVEAKIGNPIKDGGYVRIASA